MTVDTTATSAIDRDHALHLLHEMVRIRRFEERCIELYSAARRPSRSASCRRSHLTTPWSRRTESTVTPWPGVSRRAR
jgi:hypothetical protein